MLSITTELGRFEEFFSEVVYPAWPLWLAATLALAGPAGWVAYRRGWHIVAVRHRLLTGAAIALIAAVAVPVGYYTISPLFDRETVCEASPIPGAGAGSEDCEGVAVAATMPPSETPSATVAPTSTEAPVETPFAPYVVRRGVFVSADDFHFTYGDALLIESAPGRYTVRFENFSVRNGPDVFVLLSPVDEYRSDALNLGELKGTDGAFNYDVPAGTDVSRYASVIIWCRQFDVLFGSAELPA